MKVLLISPGVPQADGKGYAIRAAAMMAALEPNHEVELYVPSSSSSRRVVSAISDLLSGRPAQVGFSMPRREWQHVLQAASRADVALAITVRVVRGAVGIPLVVDHVDALSLNWAQRSRGPENLVVRLVARLEARRLRAWEKRIARWSVAQLVVSAQDGAALQGSPPPLVVPHIAQVNAMGEAERDIDVVFTGNMRYPPNRDGALWLDREILPALRLRRPGARVVVAGRGAARLPLRNAEWMSDVESIPAILARSRVAIVPLTGTGTGVPTKALEAAACGAALVVTPWAPSARRFTHCWFGGRGSSRSRRSDRSSPGADRHEPSRGRVPNRVTVCAKDGARDRRRIPNAPGRWARLEDSVSRRHGFGTSDCQGCWTNPI
jgi:Glycosyl transferases group 1